MISKQMNPGNWPLKDEYQRKGDNYQYTDYSFKSDRQDKENYNRAARYIDQEDILPLTLIYSLQKKQPWEAYGGYKLTRLIFSDEAMVWMTSDGSSAIICLVGQNIAKNSQHLIDDLNIVGATANKTCQLRLARVGDELIQKLESFGVNEIILCGYSLGGSAVACISEKATRGIIFNGGAPPTNSARPVPDNCKVYHIVGDILSTHFMRAKRIYLVETLIPREQTDKVLQIDGVQWYDIAYYHDMDRFMDHGGSFRIVTPQFEQNSLENYFFYKSGEVSDVLGSIAGLASVNFNFRRKIQLQICANPIPGSYSSKGCKEGGPSIVDKIAGAAIGGLLGGAAGAITNGVGVVPGVAAGAAAGAGLASGEKGILDLINPDIGKTITDVGDVVVAGASALDLFNNSKGGFTGKVQYDIEPPKMDRLVLKVK
jgi:hypothetical protein